MTYEKTCSLSHPRCDHGRLPAADGSLCLDQRQNSGRCDQLGQKPERTNRRQRRVCGADQRLLLVPRPDPLRAATARIIRGISSPPAGKDYKTLSRRRATFWSTAATLQTSMAMSRSMNRTTAPGTRTMPISAKSSTLRTSDIMALTIRIGASSARTLAARYLSRTLSTSAQTSTVISSARTNGCPPERAMTKTQSGM